MQEDDIKKSQDKILKFLDENFNAKNIEEQLIKLKDYDFSTLAQKENCDEDSTSIVKAIYFIVWHDKLPQMKTLDEMDNNYGGETINTFNTLFQEKLQGINQFANKEETPEFYTKIEEFRKRYLTIGNFMLLPKKSKDNFSINQKKGCYCQKYKDYFDLFAIALFHSHDFDLLKKENSFYFSKINEENFYKINFLDKYVENNKFIIKFKHENYDGQYYPYYHWKYKEPKLHKKEYIDFAVDYMKKATDIINCRAEKINQELIKKIKLK